MKQAKLTAANSTFLAAARKTWNDPIYREISRLVNTEGVEAADAYIASHRAPRDLEDRKDVRAATKDLLEFHFRAQNSTKTPDERVEASMQFHYQLEELRSMLEVLERSVDR